MQLSTEKRSKPQSEIWKKKKVKSLNLNWWLPAKINLDMKPGLKIE